MITPGNELEIENRRLTVAERYMRGWSQRQIAKEVGVSQYTVFSDLQAIRKAWKESMIRDFDEAKARELEKIDLVEREAWAAWERSQRPSVSKRKGISGKGIVDETKRTGQCGDDSFLGRVAWCITRRCAMLGLDAPVKVANTDADGNDITPDQRRAGLLGIIDSLRQRAGSAVDPSAAYGHDGSAACGEKLARVHDPGVGDCGAGG